MQEGKHISNGEFNGEAMERQGREKAVSALFFTMCKQKNQQPHFCKLMIFERKTGLGPATSTLARLRSQAPKTLRV